MRTSLPLDKEVSWDSESMEIKLILEPEARIEDLWVTTSELNLLLVTETDAQKHDASFLLPLPVDSRKVQLSTETAEGRVVQVVKLDCLQKPLKMVS